jgi:hypothetical protein
MISVSSQVDRKERQLLGFIELGSAELYEIAEKDSGMLFNNDLKSTYIQSAQRNTTYVSRKSP